MKLIRFGNAGKEQPGVQLNDGTRLDVTQFGQDYNEAFFANYLGTARQEVIPFSK